MSWIKTILSLSFGGSVERAPLSESFCEFKAVGSTIGFKESELPVEGGCQAKDRNEFGELRPCDFSDNTQLCTLRRDQGFCDIKWARKTI